MEKGRGPRGEKYTNASQQLRFAERASERTRERQGARQPPGAAHPAEHGAAGDAPGASPKLRGGLRGWGAHGKARLSPQTRGGEADLPSLPPQRTPPAPCVPSMVRPWDAGAHGLGFPTGRGMFEGLSSLSCKRRVLPALWGRGGSRAECFAIPATSPAPSPGLSLPPLSLWLKPAHSWMLVTSYNLGWRMKAQLSPLLLCPAAADRGESPSKTCTGSQ